MKKYEVGDMPLFYESVTKLVGINGDYSHSIWRTKVIAEQVMITEVKILEKSYNGSKYAYKTTLHDTFQCEFNFFDSPKELIEVLDRMGQTQAFKTLATERVE